MSIPFAAREAWDEAFNRQEADRRADAKAAEVLARAIAGDEPVGGLLAGQPRYPSLGAALAGSRRTGTTVSVEPESAVPTEAEQLGRRLFGLDDPRD